MRSDRLLATLLLLQTHQKLSAADIAARLKVSTRTVMRDVEALSSAGVPVYTDRGRHGGISILPDFTTDVTGLTDDEARALFLLVGGQAYADLGLGSALPSALRKVMAALPAAHRDGAELISQRILIDPVRWGRQAERAPGATRVFATVQHAVLGNRRVSVRYRARLDPSVRSFLVDPYGLVNKAGTWYLAADHRRRPRIFRVDRIATAVASLEPARRRRGVELGALWAQLRAEVDDHADEVLVDLRVRRASIGRFLVVHGEDLLGPMPSPDDLADGPEPWELTLRMRSVGAAQMLLAFGADVEVIAPAAVRRHLRRVVGELVDLHAPATAAPTRPTRRPPRSTPL